MKRFWLKKNECTACSACENICPRNAICLETDECGFKYPVINNNCIDCNLCENVCHNRLELVKNVTNLSKVYAAWSNDLDNRFNSTSGGLFTEIAKIILKQGGVVVGAQYNEENLVEHTMIFSEDELSKIRQSKYIQSDIGYTYRLIKQQLQNGKKVAFCGAPCQVAGLHAYLGKEYQNLLSIDFICRGMNSPKAYKAWLDEIEEKVGSHVTRVWFKYKKNGWKASPKCTRVDFSNGKYKVYSGERNRFMCGYLGPNLYIRPSCGECDFKDVTRISDVTLADFWKIDKQLDDDKGTSLVMINTLKGEEVFSKIKSNIFWQERTVEEIVEGNVCFKESVQINPKSKEFLKKLDGQKFSRALNSYIYHSLIDKLKSCIKQLLNI